MVLDIEGRTNVLFITWFARNDVVAFGMRIRLRAGLSRDKEPWATSRQAAKSNHGAFLTESERTSVNCEIVRSGYHAAQRMLEREAVHETFAISDATVFQHTGGIAFGVAEFTQRILRSVRSSSSRPNELISVLSSPVDYLPSPGY